MKMRLEIDAYGRQGLGRLRCLITIFGITKARIVTFSYHILYECFKCNSILNVTSKPPGDTTHFFNIAHLLLNRLT